MRVLSIKQPWLWAITDLDKRVENRTWPPPKWIIGKTIALHASKKDDIAGVSAIRIITNGILVPSDIPRGAIVTTAKVIGWVSSDGTANTRQCAGFYDSPWFFGPFGWVLDDVQKLPEPIPCNRSLGLWVPPAEIDNILRKSR